MSDALDNDTSFWENPQKKGANVKKTTNKPTPNMNP